MRRRIVWSRLPAANREYRVVAARRERRLESRGRVSYSGQAGDARQQTVVERVFLCGSIVLSARQRKTQRQDVVRIKTRTHIEQLIKAAHQQSGGNQQHQRDRHFGYYERTAQPIASSAG